MNSKRIYFLMVGLLIILVLAIGGGAYIGNQKLQQQSAKLADYKTQNEVLSQQQVGLIKAKKDVQAYSSLDTIAKTIVPQDKNQAEVVQETINIAAAAGIQPSAITFPTSTLGGLGTSSASSASPTNSATTNAARAVAALSQLTPVVGIPKVYSLQIIIQQDATQPVPYTKFINFLSGLEQNRRTAQVTGMVLQPSPLDHNLVSFTLTLNEFIKP